MTGEDGRHVFKVMWLRDAIARLCMRCGVSGRPRKLYLGMLGRARVISAGPFRPMSCAPLGRMRCPGRALGLLSVVRRTPRTVHGGSGRALRGRCTGGGSRSICRPHCAACRRGIASIPRRSVSATPGARNIPTLGRTPQSRSIQFLSVGCGAPVRYPWSPAHEHDHRHLTIDAFWRGDVRLAALGYARFERLRACDAHSVRVAVRPQDYWKPTRAMVFS